MELHILPLMRRPEICGVRPRRPRWWLLSQRRTPHKLQTFEEGDERVAWAVSSRSRLRRRGSREGLLLEAQVSVEVHTVGRAHVILDQTPQYLLLDEVVTLSSEEDEVVVNARNLVDVHPKEDAAERATRSSSRPLTRRRVNGSLVRKGKSESSSWS